MSGVGKPAECASRPAPCSGSTPRPRPPNCQGSRFTNALPLPKIDRNRDLVVRDEPVAVDLPEAGRVPNPGTDPVPVFQRAAEPIEAVPGRRWTTTAPIAVPPWSAATDPGPSSHVPGAATGLPICERVQGPEHPSTLASRGNLAYMTGQAGDTAGARDQYAALLPIHERFKGRSTSRPWPSAATSPAAPGRRE